MTTHEHIAALRWAAAKTLHRRILAEDANNVNQCDLMLYNDLSSCICDMTVYNNLGQVMI